MPKINGERLLADLRRIADFGRYETGVHRPHLSPQDVESRHWLAGRMKEAGLEPVIDGVGTVHRPQPQGGPAPADRLAFRHPAARRLARRRDGRDLRPRSGARAGRGSRDGASRRRRRLVGRRGGPLGPDDRQPSSFIGSFSEADIDKARHRDEGTPMRDALKAAGLDKAPRERSRGRPLSRLPRGAYRAGRPAGGRATSASASSPPSSASTRIGSPSAASRTMPARRPCRSARMPASP